MTNNVNVNFNLDQLEDLQKITGNSIDKHNQMLQVATEENREYDIEYWNELIKKENIILDLIHDGILECILALSIPPNN